VCLAQTTSKENSTSQERQPKRNLPPSIVRKQREPGEVPKSEEQKREKPKTPFIPRPDRERAYPLKPLFPIKLPDNVLPGRKVLPGKIEYERVAPQPQPKVTPSVPPNNKGNTQFDPGLLKKNQPDLTGVDYPKTGESFRIATFNTHLISPLFNKDIFDSDHADADAHTVANAIAHNATEHQSFDVLVLNEVWDEDAKAILVSTLSPIFPYYVKKMEAPDGATANAKTSSGSVQVPILEDSGMMLFSKFPFKSFKMGNSTTPLNQYFHRFEACTGVDAGAAKGVGIVVIVNPNTEHLYVVGFAHLQDGDQDVRDLQMAETQSVLMEVWAHNPETRRACEMFVLGDLNIEGFNIPEGNLQWVASESKQLPWAKHFWNNKTSFYFKPLYDGWAWTTSATDLGFTSPGGSARLDYIIHERAPAPQRYAIQHIHHIMAGETDSDHIAVVADLNLPGIAPNPRLAIRPELNKSKPEDWWDFLPSPENGDPQDALKGELKYPGSMQWYRFDTAATYSIGLPLDLVNAGLEVTVYQANDLSTPVSQFNKEYTMVALNEDGIRTYVLGKYCIAQPPFYVRVSNPNDRTWTGKYNIAFHRHRGVNKFDAIVLQPGEEPIDPKMPTDKPLNADDAVWFELVTDQTLSKKPQKMEINIKNPTADKLKLSILKEDPNDAEKTILQYATPFENSPFLEQTEVGGNKYYLTVARKDISQSGFTVGWTTNLTWMVGLGLPGGTWPFKLVCTDETDSDWAGSDEIVFQLFADGSLYSKESFGDVDTGDHYSYEGLIKPVAFIDAIEPTICEIGADDSADCSQGKILPLDKNERTKLHLWVDLFPDDGNYEFRYNLSHWLNK
jgi:hypothetical protein